MRTSCSSVVVLCAAVVLTLLIYGMINASQGWVPLTFPEMSSNAASNSSPSDISSAPSPPVNVVSTSETITLTTMNVTKPFRNARRRLHRGDQHLASAEFNSSAMFESNITSWGQPRLFEAFLFYNEIELLEIRIAELMDVVEMFVLVETLETFYGVPKVSHYDTMQHRLPAAFRAKVFHHKCSRLSGRTPWERENSARSCAKQGLVFSGARRYDLVHFNDVDEIANGTVMARIVANVRAVMTPVTSILLPTRRAIAKLATMFPLGLGMDVYYYNFRTLTNSRSDFVWYTDVFLILDARQFEKMKRFRPRKAHVLHGGWHCSWCFPTVAQYAEKFNTFSHTETVDERNYSPENVWNCTCNGGSIFKYRGPNLTIVRLEENLALSALPRYLREHMNESRFLFLFPNATTCKLPLT
jgi:beta-1,4-mannosyl-glycoprotein beta-1,4-N-acetylglucosaminyltransferase